MIAAVTEVESDWGEEADWSALVDRAMQAGLAVGSRSNRSDLSLEVSVLLTSDDEVRALNLRFRGKDKATNVLSFPMLPAEELDHIPVGVETLLGDIVLAHGICAAEAAAKGVAIADHVAHLLVHGLLHLLGHDHETGESDAEEMEDAERRALASLGIADPYIAEVQT